MMMCKWKYFGYLPFFGFLQQVCVFLFKTVKRWWKVGHTIQLAFKRWDVSNESEKKCGAVIPCISFTMLWYAILMQWDFNAMPWDLYAMLSDIEIKGLMNGMVCYVMVYYTIWTKMTSYTG